MMEPEGEGTAQRDDMMRAKHDEGLNVLSGDNRDGNVAQWDHNCELSRYEAEDEADNWWIQWGLPGERAKASQWANDEQLEMFSLDVNVRAS